MFLCSRLENAILLLKINKLCKMKSEKFRTKSEKFRTKSEKFRTKSEKFRTKSEKFRTKSEKFRSEQKQNPQGGSERKDLTTRFL